LRIACSTQCAACLRKISLSSVSVVGNALRLRKVRLT
jgi:hypothetical protein